MKRRVFCFLLGVSTFLPKALISFQKFNKNLVIKNGWLFKEKDF